VFDLQGSADLLVDDPDRVVALLVEKLGFPVPDPRWVHDRPNLGYKAIHCRVNRDVATAPTTVEVIGPGTYDFSLDAHNAAYFSMQQHRPVKTHGNVAGTADIEDVVSRLGRRHLPFRVLEPGEHLPYPIVFPGATDDPITYDPTVDGGLYLELIALDAFRISAPREPTSDLTPGALIRVESRSWIVDDLDATLAALDENIGWQSHDPVQVLPRSNCRRAVFAASTANSAAIEILEARSSDGDVGEFYGSFGAGPYAHCLGVHDVAAAADELSSRAVAFRWLQDDDRGDRIMVAPSELEGLRFELVEAS
jgi:hypothetical protein